MAHGSSKLQREEIQRATFTGRDVTFWNALAVEDINND